ncbi:methyltransferase domain-containing protein [Sphingomonas sp. SFZ2018-12]|uniref:class I SAM-dependent methyltransferase n=1 Tax=Sphingomonas sp. SFZ2018-12 TaxID=2683197 RepID=UPI001F111B43|nr:class I SAM-dependent methyltransferase [Sphingomonas sp. SFZ2018-12]MCH4892202.1 methyltransferase domain-containing protein [Sphingomonas sp. SFZ2018-12]
MSGTTAYDDVAYPATLFPATHPDHLAAIALLHGLDPPDITRARVLEIAGGDGVGQIALAAAYPEAQFDSFDLSREAVARGVRLADAAGLTNVRIEHGDLLDRAETMAGPYDYVIAHGLYAWVPDAVRAATMRLIGRVLSDRGIAFISYNALPGGHLRRAVRDMLLHHVEGITDPVARVRAAHDCLLAFSRPHDGDRPVLQAMRDVARPMLSKNLGTLFHDELGESYAPQSLSDVVAAAAGHGLRFLNDAGSTMVRDGLPGVLPGGATDDAAVVRAAQVSDYESVAFFHQSLFVRAGCAPARQLDPSVFARLYGASRVQRTGATHFRLGEDPFEVADAQLCDLLEAMATAWPARVPLARIADSPDRAEALVTLYRSEVLTLHSTPVPARMIPGARPCASPVARAQIALGGTTLFTLDHRVVAFEAPGPRAFVALLDGSRDRAELAAAWAGTPYGSEVDVDTALAQIARVPLLVA